MLSHRHLKPVRPSLERQTPHRAFFFFFFFLVLFFLSEGGAATEADADAGVDGVAGVGVGAAPTSVMSTSTSASAAPAPPPAPERGGLIAAAGSMLGARAAAAKAAGDAAEGGEPAVELIKPRSNAETKNTERFGMMMMVCAFGFFSPAVPPFEALKHLEHMLFVAADLWYKMGDEKGRGANRGGEGGGMS